MTVTTMSIMVAIISQRDSHKRAINHINHGGDNDEDGETISWVVHRAVTRHAPSRNTAKSIHTKSSSPVQHALTLFMLVVLATMSSLSTTSDAFILPVPKKMLVVDWPGASPSSTRKQDEPTVVLQNSAVKESIVSSSSSSSSPATITDTTKSQEQHNTFEDHPLFSFSRQAQQQAASMLWTVTSTPNSNNKGDDGDGEHAVSPISHVADALYASMENGLLDSLSMARTRIMSSSSEKEDSKNESSDESRESTAKDTTDRYCIGDDDDDNNNTDKTSSKSKQQRQSDLARAALLLGKKGQRALRKRISSSSSTTTSVGDRRVGSATLARQGERATAGALMDALRNKARVAAAAAAAEKDNKENDNNNNNNNNENSAHFSSPLNMNITPEAVHAAVAELLQRRRPEQYLYSPQELLSNLSIIPSSLSISSSSFFTTTASSSLQVLDSAAAAAMDAAAPSAEQVAAILASFRDSTIGVLERAEITILPPWQSTSSTLSSSTNEDVCVRVATHADDVNVANLRLSVFSDFCSQQQSQFCARSCMVIANRRNRGAVCVVATDIKDDKDKDNDSSSTNTVVLGSAEVSHHEFVGTRLAQHRLEQSILYVTEVAVNPAARRRGIGYKLLQALEDIAKQRGDGVVETMYLHVDVANQAALALYEKCGYRRVDHHDSNHGNSGSTGSCLMEPHVQAMFHEFTKSLNLHPGATKGRDHYLLYKNLVPAPTWLTVPRTSRSGAKLIISLNSKNDELEESSTLRRCLGGLRHCETSPKLMGTLGFEIPA
jgi:ribosomal protein S18 acetylase RimI-like enzyme